jgi:hypothetical protein
MYLGFQQCLMNPTLLFVLNDGNVAIQFTQRQSAAQRGAQHLPQHTEYQHPSILPQLFHQADIAQE